MIPFSDDMKSKLRFFLLSLACPKHNNDVNSAQMAQSNLPNGADYIHNELWKKFTFQSNISALLSRIGRMDLPQQFPQLIPTLFSCNSCSVTEINPSTISSLSSSPLSLLPNIFASQALNELLSELSTKRLLMDKKFFMSVAQQFVPHFTSEDGVYSILLQYIGHYISTLQSSSDLVAGIDKTILGYANHLTQILHKLLYASFATLNQDVLESTMSFLVKVTSHLLTTLISTTTLHNNTITNVIICMFFKKSLNLVLPPLHYIVLE